MRLNFIGCCYPKIFNDKLNSINPKCSDALRITYNGNKVCSMYCCRTYGSEINASIVMYSMKDYLDWLFSSFRMNERYPFGVCIKSQSSKICNCIVIPKKHIHKLSVNTFSHCNYACPDCAAKSCKQFNNTEKELLFTRELLTELKNYSFIDSLEISGFGEISVYDPYKIAELLTINQNIKQITIFTNGSNLDNINILCRILEKHSIRCDLSISFHSLNESTYKKITGNGNLKTLLYNLDHFENRNICLSVVIFKETIKETNDILDYAKRHHFNVWLAPNAFDEDIKSYFLTMKTKNKNNIFFEGNPII